MFLIDEAAVPYSDPWHHSLSHRMEMLKRGSPRIAYFYERPDNSTFRYRVYNMIQALAAAESTVAASYFTLADLEHDDHIVEACDALVVCRASYGNAVNRLITKAQSRGRKVYFDVDDFVFDTRYAHLIVNTLDQDLNHPNLWDFWFAYIGRIGGTLRLCERAITTNAFLAGQIRAFNEMPVTVIPNFLNLEQLSVSDAIYDEKQAKGYARDGRIHLGYFSGTPTHRRDFALIADTLVRLLREDPRLVLRVAGYFDLPESLQPLKDRIEVHPFRDFVNLQTLIGATEINLVPLQDNVFTNCKSELKYFEAGIVGSVSIASPTVVLRGAIQDGVTGHLANTFDWGDRIYRIIDGMDHYADMARAAREHARGTYHWSAQASAIERLALA